VNKAVSLISCATQVGDDAIGKEASGNEALGKMQNKKGKTNMAKGKLNSKEQSQVLNQKS